MITGLLVIFYLLFVILAWRRLNWAVLFVVATLPSYLLRFRVGPIPTTLLEGMILIVVLCWILKLQVRFLAIARNLTWKTGIPIGLFLLAGTIGIGIAPDLRAAAGVWKAYFVEPILFFLVINDLLRSKPLTATASEYDDRHKMTSMLTLSSAQIIGALSLTAILLSAYAIFQRFTGFGIPPPWDQELRVTSIFPYPNALALFLGPLIPLFAAKLLLLFSHPEQRPQAGVEGSRAHARQYLLTTYYLLLTTLSLLAIVFAKSTGALVGIAAGLLPMGYFWLRKISCGRRKSSARKFFILHSSFLILVLVGVISVLLNAPRIKEEVLLRDWSGHVRRTQWAETVEMLKDRPILGAGLSGYPEVFKPYHQATYLEIFQYPHNLVLNFWSEVGLLGLVAFIWLIIIFFKKIYILRPTPHVLGALGAMTALLVHGLVDVPYFKNDLAILFWIIFTLGLTNAQKNESINNYTA